MTDETIWENASIGGRLDLIREDPRRWLKWDAPKPAKDLTTREVCDALEAGRDKTVASLIEVNELARLKRIEAAAKDAEEFLSARGLDRGYASRAVFMLREALRS